jgi:hypothetical protein
LLNWMLLWKEKLGHPFISSQFDNELWSLVVSILVYCCHSLSWPVNVILKCRLSTKTHGNFNNKLCFVYIAYLFLICVILIRCLVLELVLVWVNL